MGSKNSICYNSKQIEKNYSENELIKTYSSNLDQIRESFNCMVCLMKVISFTPSCGHMGLCEECNEINKKTSYRNMCMICKKRVVYNKVILPFSCDLIDSKKYIITESKDNVKIKSNFCRVSKDIIEDFKKEMSKLNNKMSYLVAEEMNYKLIVSKSKDDYNNQLLKTNSLKYKNNYLTKEKQNLSEKIKVLQNKLNDLEFNIEDAVYYNEELKKENDKLKQENNLEYNIQDSLHLYDKLKKCNDDLKKENENLKKDNYKYFIENYIFKEDNKLLKVSSDVNIYDLENDNISEDLIYIKSLNGKSENLEPITEEQF